MSAEEANTPNQSVEKTGDATATPEVQDAIANKPLQDMVVQDGIIMVQLLDRLFARGAVQGREALPVSILRQKLVESLDKQGVKLDQPAQ